MCDLCGRCRDRPCISVNQWRSRRSFGHNRRAIASRLRGMRAFAGYRPKSVDESEFATVRAVIRQYLDARRDKASE